MLGERLAEIRKNYHDTQKSLADKLGLTVWAVSAWEQGRNSPPSDVLLAILLMNIFAPLIDYCIVQKNITARENRLKSTNN